MDDLTIAIYHTFEAIRHEIRAIGYRMVGEGSCAAAEERKADIHADKISPTCCCGREHRDH